MPSKFCPVLIDIPQPTRRVSNLSSPGLGYPTPNQRQTSISQTSRVSISASDYAPNSYYLRHRRGVTIGMQDSAGSGRKRFAGLKHGLSVLNKDLQMTFLVSDLQNFPLRNNGRKKSYVTMAEINFPEFWHFSAVSSA